MSHSKTSTSQRIAFYSLWLNYLVHEACWSKFSHGSQRVTSEKHLTVCLYACLCVVNILQGINIKADYKVFVGVSVGRRGALCSENSVAPRVCSQPYESWQGLWANNSSFNFACHVSSIFCPLSRMSIALRLGMNGEYLLVESQGWLPFLQLPQPFLFLTLRQASSLQPQSLSWRTLAQFWGMVWLLHGYSLLETGLVLASTGTSDGLSTSWRDSPRGILRCSRLHLVQA